MTEASLGEMVVTLRSDQIRIEGLEELKVDTLPKIVEQLGRIERSLGKIGDSFQSDAASESLENIESALGHLTQASQEAASQIQSIGLLTGLIGEKVLFPEPEAGEINTFGFEVFAKALKDIGKLSGEASGAIQIIAQAAKLLLGENGVLTVLANLPGKIKEGRSNLEGKLVLFLENQRRIEELKENAKTGDVGRDGTLLAVAEKFVRDNRSIAGAIAGIALKLKEEGGPNSLAFLEKLEEFLREMRAVTDDEIVQRQLDRVLENKRPEPRPEEFKELEARTGKSRNIESLVRDFDENLQNIGRIGEIGITGDARQDEDLKRMLKENLEANKAIENKVLEVAEGRLSAKGRGAKERGRSTIPSLPRI